MQDLVSIGFIDPSYNIKQEYSLSKISAITFLEATGPQPSYMYAYFVWERRTPLSHFRLLATIWIYNARIHVLNGVNVVTLRVYNTQ